MRVLVVKTSSLGDVIHTLPAITDASAHIPGIRFDWAIEEAFADIPALHPAVQRVIPVALRRWRKRPWAADVRREWKACKAVLREHEYDLVIDAQGLIKSVWLARKARGPICGMDKSTVREPLAALAYQRSFNVARGVHAIDRLRRLFALSLDYPLPESVPDYGLDISSLAQPQKSPYLLFLHGTSWENKHWPEAYWRALARQAVQENIGVVLPWGSEAERARAERIAADIDGVAVLPKMDLAAVSAWVAHARAVVGVDTGLVHLAAALAVPTVALFGPTNATLTGVRGARQQNLVAEFECAPCLKRECGYSGSSEVKPACFQDLTAARVWAMLQTLLPSD